MDIVVVPKFNACKNFAPIIPKAHWATWTNVKRLQNTCTHNCFNSHFSALSGTAEDSERSTRDQQFLWRHNKHCQTTQDTKLMK